MAASVVVPTATGLLLLTFANPSNGEVQNKGSSSVPDAVQVTGSMLRTDLMGMYEVYQTNDDEAAAIMEQAHAAHEALIQHHHRQRASLQNPIVARSSSPTPPATLNRRRKWP